LLSAVLVKQQTDWLPREGVMADFLNF